MKGALHALLAGCVLAGCSQNPAESSKTAGPPNASGGEPASQERRQEATGSRVVRLDTAASLHAEGLRRRDKGESEAASSCFGEAYKTRRELLGLLDTNTCASLEGLALGGGARVQPETALEWLADLETAITNLYTGRDLTNRLVTICERRVSLYERLGRNAEAEATQGRLLRLAGLTDAQIAAQAEAMKRIQAQGESTAREMEKVAKQLEAIQSGLAPKVADILKTNTAAKNQMDLMHGLIDALAGGLQRRGSGGTNGSAVPKSEADLKNVFRDVLGGVATNYPELLAHMKKPKAPSGETLEEWFQDQWEKWNEEYEDGLPPNRLVGQKQYSNPLLMMPSDPEPSGKSMSLLALNLKGLLLEREFRLQAALAQSTDPAVAGWRNKLWDLQLESLRSRPIPIDPAAQGYAPRQVLENSPFTLLLNDKLEKEQKKFRRLALALPEAGRKPVVTANEIRSKLPARSALIEFVRYGRDFGGLNPIEERFGAAIITNDKEPAWVDLQSATNISGLVNRYVTMMRARGDAAPSGGDGKAMLEKLAEVVWAPLETALPGDLSTIFISADSELHLLSFATLLRHGKFLAERHDFVYVLGGRDVLATNAPMTGPRIVDIWGDADFNLVPSQPTAAAATVGRPAAIPAVRGYLDKFDSLPGTRREAMELKELAGKQPNHSVQMHLDRNATEVALRQVQRPFLLHLGTHGMFLPLEDPKAATPWRTGGLRNQFNGDAGLFQSGIALAGANRTFEAWRRNEIPLPGDDGILVAAEAAQLNLRGTWLVTLSACDTGAGGVAEGESLLGIKLGFLQAGARNVCVSLWRLDDDNAARFLKLFYEGAFQTTNAATTLAKVQRDELKRLSTPGTGTALWNAAKQAGPFVMTTRGL